LKRLRGAEENRIEEEEEEEEVGSVSTGFICQEKVLPAVPSEPICRGGS